MKLLPVLCALGVIFAACALAACSVPPQMIGSAAPGRAAAATTAGATTAEATPAEAAGAAVPTYDPNNLQTATLAGGCFWSMQRMLDTVPGVITTTVGYTGGSVPNPTYEQVSSETTGHAEAVEVVYDAGPDQLCPSCSTRTGMTSTR